jgi:hypothetical protein
MKSEHTKILSQFLSIFLGLFTLKSSSLLKIDKSIRIFPQHLCPDSLTCFGYCIATNDLASLNRGLRDYEILSLKELSMTVEDRIPEKSTAATEPGFTMMNPVTRLIRWWATLLKPQHAPLPEG